MNRQPTLIGELVEVRPLAAGDFADLHAAAGDPLVWEQHPDKARWREDVFRTYFDDHLASGGALAIIERASGALIGATRYDNFDPERSEVEIGWTFLARPVLGRYLQRRPEADHARARLQVGDHSRVPRRREQPSLTLGR